MSNIYTQVHNGLGTSTDTGGKWPRDISLNQWWPGANSIMAWGHQMLGGLKTFHSINSGPGLLPLEIY